MSGPTHLNFSCKTITALVLIERFGSPTQMIGDLSRAQNASAQLPEE
jgi:hypothetical protein